MNLKKTLAVVAVMTVAASLTAPAALAKGRKDEGKGGKKAIAEVTAFDAATGALALTLNDGSTFAGNVTEDTKVKVEHRGNHARGKGHGNPSNGDASDLVAGTKVLKFKTDDDDLTVKKIRIRPLATSTTPTTEAECDESDESDEADLEDDTDEAAEEVDAVEDGQESADDAQDSADDAQDSADEVEEVASDDCDEDDADEADDADDEADDADESDESGADEADDADESDEDGSAADDSEDDSDEDDSDDDGGDTDPAQCDPLVDPLGCVAPVAP